MKKTTLRQDGGDTADNSAGQSSRFVSRQRREIDGNRTGRGLGNSGQLHDLLLREKMLFLDKVFTDHRYHHIASPKGKGADK